MLLALATCRYNALAYCCTEASVYDNRKLAVVYPIDKPTSEVMAGLTERGRAVTAQGVVES